MKESVEEFLARGGQIDVVEDHTRNKSFRDNRFKNNARGVPSYKSDSVSRSRAGHKLRRKT